MSINVLMPALSPTMEQGKLAKWLKKEGDKIKSGDVIAEIETDKATMEVEAVDEGVLAKIIIPDGTEQVAVNTPIAIIAEDGEDVSAIASAGTAAPAAAPTPAAATAPASAPAAIPVASAPAPAPVVATGGARVFSSPLARRLAKEGGLDLTAIKGTGPHGRIIERDVKAAIAAGPQAKAAPAPAAAPAAAPAPVSAAAAGLAVGMSDETIKKFFPAGSYEEVPHDSMRKTIARRLVEAKQTIPHFYLTVDCELDALLALREQVNATAPKDKDGKPAFKVSVNDFIIKGLALALIQVPDANVTWTEGAMLRHKHADVGVAVSIPGGLITPIIRSADTKSLSAISNEMKDYAARAKGRKLKPEEYQGGTSAVSNLGMFGIKNFQAVINPPHATILAIGAGEQRVIVKNGAPAVATLMTVTLSTDHRAVDGVLGAQLIGAFKSLIENPMAMLV
ncbi:pyruvate dehydrogenase complex dihydrolipoamide acetyltransferase [Beijerinckia mobilis]|uniref:pyruvate dehydrogenase complex dihydrolipoamide acetyltransferase n=1 Tax=Beijerinckia mobilis TaxID=231434 RepID=UPI00054EE0F0|nr:pyruvate dehydrogenase complex dihydrolipoamide acetyltransferase [Beijerinckia mobilis]